MSIETLGMKSLLVKKKLWDTLPKEENDLQEDLDSDTEDDDEDDNYCLDESIVAAATQETMIENASEIEEDVYNLSKNELISSQAVANVKQMFERIPSLNFESSISLFHPKENNRKGTVMDLKKGSHSPFMEVKIDSCSINFKRANLYQKKQSSMAVSRG